MERRTRVVGLLTAGLVAGSMVATAPVAHGATNEPFHGGWLTTDVLNRVTATSGNTCVLGGGNASEQAYDDADAPQGNGAISTSLTSQSSHDTGDATATGRVDTRSSSTTVGGHFTTLSVSTRLVGRVMMTDQGGACRPRSWMRSSAGVQVRLTRAGTLTMRATASAAAGQTSLTVSAYPNAGFRLNEVEWSSGLHSSAGARTVSTRVPPGYYRFDVHSDGTAELPASTGNPAAIDVGWTSTVTFTPDPPATTSPAGAAIGKTKGKARKLVTFPRTRSCASGTAKARWTKKARKQRKRIKRIVLTVGKRKVGRIKSVKPKQVRPRKAIRLQKLPRKAVTVKATVFLRNGKKVAAKQRYSAC